MADTFYELSEFQQPVSVYPVKSSENLFFHLNDQSSSPYKYMHIHRLEYPTNLPCS